MLWQWSPTAANNATAATNINWAEGQAPSTVNDSARQMMADIATWFQNGAEWLNMGDVPTYVSGTQFTIPGNLTARYPVGRRVRASVTAGTVYGTINASAYTSLTTVTVTWDSGALDSGLSEVDVGILNPANPSIAQLNALTLIGNLFVTNPGGGTPAAIKLIGNGTTTPNKFLKAANGTFLITNSGDTAVLVSVDDSGNMTVTGNLTANSDERLKSDWEYMPRDFIERLAAVKSGTYARVDIGDGKRHAGVSAQSLQALLPEAVLESEKGLLSVAYGNAALVACVELAKEVVRLRALVESK
jgi:hypothetical protein